MHILCGVVLTILLGIRWSGIDELANEDCHFEFQGTLAGIEFLSIDVDRDIQKLYNTLRSKFLLLDYSEKFPCLSGNSSENGVILEFKLS